MSIIDYSIEHYETDKELVPYVRIVNKQPYINYAIYRLELPDVKYPPPNEYAFWLGLHPTHSK